MLIYLLHSNSFYLKFFSLNIIAFLSNVNPGAVNEKVLLTKLNDLKYVCWYTSVNMIARNFQISVNFSKIEIMSKQGLILVSEKFLFSVKQ